MTLISLIDPFSPAVAMALAPGDTLVDYKSTTFSHAAEQSSPSQLVANNSLSEVIIC